MADAASRSAKSGTKAAKPAAQGPKAAAKEAKVKAKEAKKAEKARKKASDNPADMGRIRQIIRAYQVTHEYDKALPYLLIGAFLLPTVLSIACTLSAVPWRCGVLLHDRRILPSQPSALASCTSFLA